MYVKTYNHSHKNVHKVLIIIKHCCYTAKKYNKNSFKIAVFIFV